MWVPVDLPEKNEWTGFWWHYKKRMLTFPCLQNCLKKIMPEVAEEKKQKRKQQEKTVL